MARGWIVDNKLQCSLFPTIWAETPEVWGILLADFAAHVSDAIAAESDMSREQVHRIIAKRLIDERDLPIRRAHRRLVDIMETSNEAMADNMVFTLAFGTPFMLGNAGSHCYNPT